MRAVRLVLGKGDHADAGDQIDDGVGVAKRRAVGMLAALVIGRIVLAVRLDAGLQAFQRCRDIRLGGVEIDNQRADLGAQEVVGAGRAERRERFHVLGADELQHGILVVEMADHMGLFRDHAADGRHQARGDGAAFRRRQRLVLLATEDRLAGGLRFEPGNRRLMMSIVRA